MCLSIVLFCSKRNFIGIRTDEQNFIRQITQWFCIFQLERIQEKLLATRLECCSISNYAIHPHGWQIKLSEINIVTLICLNDISPCGMLAERMHVLVRV